MENIQRNQIHIEKNHTTYSATFTLVSGEMKCSVALIDITDLSKCKELVEAIKSNGNYSLSFSNSGIYGNNSIGTCNGKTTFVTTKWIARGNSVMDVTIPNKEALPLIEELANA